MPWKHRAIGSGPSASSTSSASAPSAPSAPSAFRFRPPLPSRTHSGRTSSDTPSTADPYSSPPPPSGGQILAKSLFKGCRLCRRPPKIDFLKNRFVCIIRLLGGFGMAQNIPTGCVNNLAHTFEKSYFLLKLRSANCSFMTLF